jgi:cell wall-associated NlpC family hydrolase
MKEISQYRGAPGLMYGRDPNVGIDCLGLVAMAATQAGFDCPNMLIRTPGPDGKVPPMMDRIAADMVPVKLDDLRVGDMLWLKFPTGRVWDHLAVVSDNNPLTIIHTDPTFFQSVKEHRLSESIVIPDMFTGLSPIRLPMSWANLLHGAFRFKHLYLEKAPEVTSVLIRSSNKTIARLKLNSPLHRGAGA